MNDYICHKVLKNEIGSSFYINQVAGKFISRQHWQAFGFASCTDIIGPAFLSLTRYPNSWVAQAKLQACPWSYLYHKKKSQFMGISSSSKWFTFSLLISAIPSKLH